MRLWHFALALVIGPWLCILASAADRPNISTGVLRFPEAVERGMLLDALPNQFSGSRFYGQPTKSRVIGVFIGPQPVAETVEITAHRGASHRAPENTLASVKLAWELDADSVEIDILQTKDGRIVAIHDKSTARTAGVELNVAETPLEALRKLDVGRWKGKRFAGEKIPTLEEILATIPDGKRLLIEIKCGKEVVPELKRVLSAAGKRPQQTALICFDPHVLQAAKRAMPKLHVQWVVGTIPERDKQTGKIRVSVADLIASCRGANFDGLSVRGDSEIDEEFVKAFHDAGLELHVWTVNSPEQFKQLVELGVDAITTDRPDYLRKQLGGE